MFCWGCIGFVAGLLVKAGIFGPIGKEQPQKNGKRRKPIRLCIYGLASGFAYGWVMNLFYIIGYVRPLTWQTVAAAYVSSFFFDLSHGICTMLVLYFVGEAWIRKLLRIKRKFGLTGEERSYVMPPGRHEEEGTTNHRNKTGREALSGRRFHHPCSGWD